MDELRIAVATGNDAADIAAIYAPYVKDTAITFEYEAPSAQEMSARIGRVSATSPWLIARDAAGAALGYAYANSYYGRAAYAWCVETSIYVARDARGQGVGTTLYQELERSLAAQGILNLYACVTIHQHTGRPSRQRERRLPRTARLSRDRPLSQLRL